MRIVFILIPLALMISCQRQEMEWQPSYRRAYDESPFFDDGMSSRLPVAGTYARGQLRTNTHLYQGRVKGDWALNFPISIKMEDLERGRQRFEIFCLICHG